MRPISRRDALLLGGLGTVATAAGAAGLWWSLASPRQPLGGALTGPGPNLLGPPELRSENGRLQLTLDAARTIADAASAAYPRPHWSGRSR